MNFSIAVETATLSEIELSEYCRAKGLFVEQVELAGYLIAKKYPSDLGGPRGRMINASDLQLAVLLHCKSSV